MIEDLIKHAFAKVKEDIQFLKKEIQEIKQALDRQTDKPTDRQIIQTDVQTVPTDENPFLEKTDFNALKPENLLVSTGNRGVQTDRQTNRQTDRHAEEVRLTQQKQGTEDPLTKIDKLSETLNSLDIIKKDLRAKFKKLTPQEMLIFSAIYQIEEQQLVVDYALIAAKTKLSESSIRDYVQKLVKKGIPVDKTKENNKKITLSIHPDLRKIASLNTILQLREL